MGAAGNSFKGLLVAIALAFVSAASLALPVFPGAVGYGTDTPAGRNGTVIKVTNLHETGPGSFQAALRASGARVIVFEVGGTITWSSSVPVTNPYLTVAGQTAPWPGITVKGAGMTIATHDVLVQHIAMRPGDEWNSSCPQPPAGQPPTALGCERKGLAVDLTAANVVFDHVTVTWSVDELFTIWSESGTVQNVTISNSLFAEPLRDSIHPDGEHPFGPYLAKNGSRVTYYRNISAFASARNPRIAQQMTDVVLVNNLIYWPGIFTGGKLEFGDSPSTLQLRSSVVGNVVVLRPDNSDTPAVALSPNATPNMRLYLDNNRVYAWNATQTYLPANGSPWDPSVVSRGARCLSNQTGCTNPIDVSSPTSAAWNTGLSVMTEGVEASLLANSGARPLDRDNIDTRIINLMKNRDPNADYVDSPSDVGGYYNGTTYGSFATYANDGDDDDGDGYTNLEERLHALAANLEGHSGAEYVLEDFDGSAPSTWTQSGVTSWAVVPAPGGGGVYQQTDNTDDARTVFGATDWTTQVIEADLKPLTFNGTNRWLGLYARFSDEHNHYYVSLRNTNVIELRKSVQGTLTSLASQSLTVTPGQTYRVRLEAVGSTIRVYLNGASILQATDTSLTTGRVGLGMYKATAEFDNVFASSAPPQISYRDDFEDGTAAEWESTLGTWSVQPSGGSIVYRQSSMTGDARATLRGSGWTDESIQADITPVTFDPNSADPWVGLYVRYRDASNYYYVTARKSGQVLLRKMVGGVFTQLAATTITMTAGQTYQLRLEAAGSQLRVYLGNNPTPLLQATNTELTSGRVGLIGYKTYAEYDNVVLSR